MILKRRWFCSFSTDYENRKDSHNPRATQQVSAPHHTHPAYDALSATPHPSKRQKSRCVQGKQTHPMQPQRAEHALGYRQSANLSNNHNYPLGGARPEEGVSSRQADYWVTEGDPGGPHPSEKLCCEGAAQEPARVPLCP